MVFKLHILSSIPSFFGTALGGWLLIENKQKVIISLQVLCLSLYIPLSYFLISKYNINGAALAIVSSIYLAQLLVMLLYNKAEIFILFIKSFNPIHLVNIYKYLKS
jgi:Na+-driven multidrug efflux pump